MARATAAASSPARSVVPDQAASAPDALLPDRASDGRPPSTSSVSTAMSESPATALAELPATVLAEARSQEAGLPRQVEPVASRSAASATGLTRIRVVIGTAVSRASRPRLTAPCSAPTPAAAPVRPCGAPR
ncbi:hypothetical protein ND747_15915, partial [Frankia sp. R82]